MTESEWFYLGGGEELGPVSRQALIDLAEEGVIKADTYVKRAGSNQPAFAATLTQLFPVGLLDEKIAARRIRPAKDSSDVSQSKPWFSIWLSPRTTLRQLFDSKSGWAIHILAALGGVLGFIELASTKKLANDFSFGAILCLSPFIGALSGILGLYVSAAVLQISGRLLGGTGTFTRLRTAIAWSAIPAAVELAIWLMIVAVSGRFLFVSSGVAMDSVTAMVVLLLIVLLFCVKVWQLVIGLQCIGEAHGFSAWKALLCIVLPGLLLFLVGLLILLLWVVMTRFV